MKSRDVTHHTGYDGNVYTTVEDQIETLRTSVAAVGFRNHLINGWMALTQRGTSFTDAGSANSDDRYTLDRWVLLSDGNDIVDVSRDTADVPTNGLYAAKLLVVTVNKKFGLLQVVEQKNCIGLIGSTVTLSFKAKVSNTTRLATCKAVILAWSSTADSVTSDVVSSWNADSATPTWATNWTAENTPADLNLTTSWASYSLSAAIDTASAKNIAVFIWSDNVTDTDANDTMHITDVQLEIGSTATTFDRRPFPMEVMLCERYYQKTYNLDTAPGTATYQGAAGGPATATDRVKSTFSFKTRMRGVPTMALYDPSDGSANAVRDDGNVQKAFVTPAFDGADENGFRNCRDAGGTPLTAGTGYNFHYTADAEL